MPNVQKTILMTVTEPSVATNFLRGAFLPLLMRSPEVRLVLVVPPEKEEAYQKEFGNERIKVRPFNPLPLRGLEKIIAYFARNSVRTGMVHFNQVRQYLADRNWFAFLLKRLIWFLFGRSRMFQWVIREIDRRIFPHPATAALFDEEKPDVVFAAIAPRPDIDIPILREGLRRIIPTISMTRGWDNFTAHGVFRVIPDLFLFQNNYLVETGRRLQFLDPQKLKVVGFPLYDWFSRRDLIEPRDVFLKKVGIDPNARVILFGAMEHFWFPRDNEIAEIFGRLVDEGKIPADCVMLFRPYPGGEGPFERAKKARHTVVDEIAFTKFQADSLEVKQAQMAHLMNSMYHSEMVVSVASTILLDAIAMGKPAISVAVEHGSPDYWSSVYRFRDHCTHFEDLVATGGVWHADTPDEFARAVNTYLQNSEHNPEGRKRIKDLFLTPSDGKVGDRIAEILTERLH